MAHSQNSNKSTSVVPQVIRFPTLFKIYISEINFFPKDVQISTYAYDIIVTVSHTNHHLSPTIYSRIFLQSITLFTPDPAEYGTTLSFKLNNQTPTTTKHPKTLGITFDPKLTFLQHISLTVIKAKQTLNIRKALTSNK